MSDINQKDQLRSTMLRYLDGQLTENEIQDLEHKLKESPELIEEFAHFSLNHAQLLSINEHKNQEFYPEFNEKVIPFPHGRRIKLGALACGLIFVFTFFVWKNLNQPNSQSGAQVELISSNQPIFDSDSPELKIGNSQYLKSLKLSSGSLTLRVGDNATFFMEGPSSVTFIDDMKVRLDIGRVTLTADEDVIGFTVETPSTQVKDIGTKFGVSVDSSGTSDVVVFDGEVELNKGDLDSGNHLTRLKAGQALRISKGRAPQRISSVVSQHHSDSWATNSALGAIRRVTDNVSQRWSYRFYPVIRSGFEEGVLAWPYTESNKPKWWSTQGTGMPSELEGADVVQMLQQELSNDTLEVQIDLARPSRLFIFFEVNAPVPNWLQQNFKPTQLELRLSPDSPQIAKEFKREPNYAVQFKVWSQDIETAQTVSLGAVSKVDENSPPFYMYGVAAKPLTKLKE